MTLLFAPPKPPIHKIVPFKPPSRLPPGKTPRKLVPGVPFSTIQFADPWLACQALGTKCDQKDSQKPKAKPPVLPNEWQGEPGVRYNVDFTWLTSEKGSFSVGSPQVIRYPGRRVALDAPYKFEWRYVPRGNSQSSSIFLTTYDYSIDNSCNITLRAQDFELIQPRSWLPKSCTLYTVVATKVNVNRSCTPQLIIPPAVTWDLSIDLKPSLEPPSDYAPPKTKPKVDPPDTKPKPEIKPFRRRQKPPQRDQPPKPEIKPFRRRQPPPPKKDPPPPKREDPRPPERTTPPPPQKEPAFKPKPKFTPEPFIRPGFNPFPKPFVFPRINPKPFFKPSPLPGRKERKDRERIDPFPDPIPPFRRVVPPDRKIDPPPDRDIDPPPDREIDPPPDREIDPPPDREIDPPPDKDIDPPPDKDIDPDPDPPIDPIPDPIPDPGIDPIPDIVIDPIPDIIPDTEIDTDKDEDQDNDDDDDDDPQCDIKYIFRIFQNDIEIIKHTEDTIPLVRPGQCKLDQEIPFEVDLIVIADENGEVLCQTELDEVSYLQDGQTCVLLRKIYTEEGNQPGSDCLALKSSIPFGGEIIYSLCSSVGCPEPYYGIVCQDENCCPPGTCAVECNGVICCYDSSGKLVTSC